MYVYGVVGLMLGRRGQYAKAGQSAQSRSTITAVHLSKYSTRSDLRNVVQECVIGRLRLNSMSLYVEDTSLLVFQLSTHCSTVLPQPYLD